MKRPPAHGTNTSYPPPVNSACSRPSIQTEKTRCGSAATTVSTSNASGISTPDFAVYESGSPASTFPLTHAPHRRSHAGGHHTEPSSEFWGHNTDLAGSSVGCPQIPVPDRGAVCGCPDSGFVREEPSEVNGYEVR